MRNKTKRLLAIRKLIENEQICSQEELLFRLKELNVEATQSTLSRDLKNEQTDEKASTIVTDAISSIDFSGNIAVMKTLPGYAKAVTVLIDNENYFEVLGTIGGDDTVLIVMREGVTHNELLDALSSIHANIHSLFK